MTSPQGRSTQAMNKRQPHHDEPSVDPAMESLLDAYARRLAHRPGLVDRVIAAAPMPTPRAARPLAPWSERRIARMALAASVCAAMVVGMLFMRPAPSAAIAASPIEAEPVLVSLLAGSDEAMLDDHPFGSELRTMDSNWSGLADEVRDIVAVVGGQR
jgi:negative regulator of sigma E activity